MESNEDVHKLLAKTEKLPPKDEKEWTPLHYLQDCILSKSKMFVDDDQVKFPAKNKAFSFNECTNFQASDTSQTRLVQSTSNPTKWQSTTPFYTLGTLAFLMQCKGLKYTAYVQRTLALAHVQYIKKKDVDTVFQYLLGKCENLPQNVRSMKEMKEKKSELDTGMCN